MEAFIGHGNAHGGLKADGRLGAGGKEAAHNEFIQALLVLGPVILAGAVPETCESKS